MQSIYNYPQYCYLAYNWPRDYECNFIIDCLKSYLPLQRQRKILDIACGPGVLAGMLSQRGYQVTALDINKKMVEFLQRKVKNVLPVRADMADFHLPGKFNAAICMMDSFRYLLTREAIIQHLRCAAKALCRRGIYIVDFWVPGKNNEPPRTILEWENQGKNSRIKACYKQLPLSFDREKNIFRDQLAFAGKIKNKRFYVTGNEEKTVYLPRELFLKFVEQSGVFELADWFWEFSFSARINPPGQNSTDKWRMGTSPHRGSSPRTKTNRLIAVLKKRDA